MDEIDFYKHSSFLTETTDFTLYSSSNEGNPHPLLPPSKVGGLTSSKQVQLAAINGAFRDGAVTTEARALICPCFRGQWLSHNYRATLEPVLPKNAEVPIVDPIWRNAPWGSRSSFLIETCELVSAIMPLILGESAASPSGLVVFSGSTDSGKSNIARAFALEVIRLRSRARSGARLPHLVTFEDPIETWELTWESARPVSAAPDLALKRSIDSPPAAADCGFCFTPREKGKDVATLASALSDAKRQTPSCFYIGELRAAEDWKHVLEFAGSGHLVVTTTHASSLADTVLRILDARNATTPAHRRSIAGCLTGCIHLKRAPLGKTKVILPSLWSHQGAALNSLVADGLSSVVPNGAFVWSRKQFFNTLFRIDRKLQSAHLVDRAPSQTLHRQVDFTLAAEAMAHASRLDIEDLTRQ